MITIYGYVPAWGLPDISPFVTKLVNYCVMAGVEYDWQAQDLGTLGSDSPTAKLPYIIDDDGTKVNDSSQIIAYLAQKHGDKLDASLGAEQHAVGHAFQRMVEECTYWNSVIQPRWRYPENFEIYIPYIVSGAEVGPELRAALDAFRDKIVDEFDKQGFGTRPDAEVVAASVHDFDAMSAFLDDKPFFLGDEPTSYDATIYSTVRHVTDVPWDWEGRTHARSKTNLVAYADRMRQRFGI